MSVTSSSAALSLRNVARETPASLVPQNTQAFDFEKWARNRRRVGSVADLARRMYEANITLAEAFERLEGCLVLEALMANDGVQLRAAKTLGCHRNQLRHKVQNLGFTARKIRSIALALKTLRESTDSLHEQPKVVEGK